MSTVKREYPHAFFKVDLSYDETKTETDYEKELVKRYLDFLDKLQAKRDFVKDVRNRYYHLQLLEDDATPELDKMLEHFSLLLKSGAGFTDGKRNDRDEFFKLKDEFITLNHKYLEYHENVVNQIRALLLDVEKDFDALYTWFETEEGSSSSEAFAIFNEYSEELYHHYDKYSLDLTSFDKSVDTMKGEWQNLDKEWDDFFAAREKIVAFTNSYNKKITGANGMNETLNEIVNQLSEGKFKPQKVEIEVLDSKCIQFRLLEKEMFSDPDDARQLNVQFRLDFDLDKLAENLWIFNMDNYVRAEGELFLHVRNSFKVPMHKEIMFKRETAQFLVDLGFKNAFNCADQFYKKEKKEFDWSKFKMPDESREFIINNLVERMADFDDAEADAGGYYNPCMKINASVLARGTVLIINEVLFNNPAFLWEENQKAFSEIIQLPVYVTLYCIINKAAQEPQEINVKQLLALMLCIECASQLLTGDHLTALEPRLNELFKFDETVRARYLKEAQEFISDALASFKKIDSKFVDMEDDYRDWNTIIK